MLPRITGTIAAFVGILAALVSLYSFTQFYAEVHDGALYASPLSMLGVFLSPVHPLLTLVGAALGAVAYWRLSEGQTPSGTAPIWHLLGTMASGVGLMVVSALGQRAATLSGAEWTPWISQYIGNAVWLGGLGFLGFKVPKPRATPQK